MTLLDLIAKAAGLSGPELVAFLERIAAEVPDLAPKADEILAALSVGLSPANLTAIGVLVMTELGQIGHGQFSGRPHPSDL